MPTQDTPSSAARPEAVFVSFGVPDSHLWADQAATTDAAAVGSAFSSLLYVVLGRRRLAFAARHVDEFMASILAENLGADPVGWLSFQPLSDSTDSKSEASITALSVGRFSHGVFIGGGGDDLPVFDEFQRLHPAAVALPLASTGGAAAEIAVKLGIVDGELHDQRDYIGLLHRRLGVSPLEIRYSNPQSQPVAVEDRIFAL